MLNLVLLAVRGAALRFLKGAVVDTAKVVIAKPAKALVDGIKEVAVENVNSPDGGVGKPDYIRVLGVIVVVGFAVALATGYITIDEFMVIMNKIESMTSTTPVING